MSLAKNIVKYRKKNQLSQEQLAQALSISRQSISKWETGENLPSIDNLISLSGLLDISLDELITGEPYLHFPYNYGKPKNNVPVFLLILFVFLVAIGFGFGMHHFYAAILGGFAAYVLTILFNPFDFKRYYTYWTLGKKGITYVDNNQDVYSSLAEIWIPIKTLLHFRKTEFISYKDMKQIEVKVDLFKYATNKSVTPGGYAPTQAQYMHEGFHLIITTNDDQTIYLDLRQYYWPKSSERQMLSTILSFLKRKNIQFIDPQNISELVMDRSISLTHKLYALRDEEETNHDNVRTEN